MSQLSTSISANFIVVQDSLVGCNVTEKSNCICVTKCVAVSIFVSNLSLWILLLTIALVHGTLDSRAHESSGYATIPYALIINTLTMLTSVGKNA